MNFDNRSQVTKAGRLTKLLKLVRVAKSVKIFEKYGENFALWMKVVAVVMAVVWLVHFWTCMWFVVGDTVEECTAVAYVVRTRMSFD